MAKVIFEYDQHEDSELIDTVRNAPKMHSVLWDMDQTIFRSFLKYDDYSVLNLVQKTLTESERALIYDAVETLRSKFHELLSANGIVL